MRIFIGIDIEAGVLTKIERFVEGVQGFAPEVRWIQPASLHITLKFIGEQTQAEVERIGAALVTINQPPFEMEIADYGFFPTAKAPRVFWIGVDGDDPLRSLAMRIDDKLEDLGFPRDERHYSPHLTLARGPGKSSGSPVWKKSDRPNNRFDVLQKRLEHFDALKFGTTAVREFVLYQSQLSASGSKYTRLRRFPLQSL